MEKYYLHLGGEQKGPFSLGQLREMWRTGAINLDTQFWTKADSEWKTMETLLDLLEPSQPAAPPASANPPASTPLSHPPTRHANAPAARTPESGECLETVSARQSAAQSNAPRPVPANEVKQGGAIGGWVCFGLGVLSMYLSVWSFFIYGPLFFVAFILAIVAMAQKRIGSGVMLLLCSLVIPPVLWFYLGLTRTAKAVESAAQWMSEQDRQMSRAPSPSPISTQSRSTTNSSADEPTSKRSEQAVLGFVPSQPLIPTKREPTAAELEETRRLEMETSKKKEMKERIIAEEAANMAQMSKLLCEGARFPGRITNAKTLQSAKIVMRVMTRSGTELTAIFENPDKATETRLIPGKIEFSGDTNHSEETACPAVANLKTTDQKEIVVKNDGTPIPLKLSAPAMFYLVPGTVRLNINNSGGLQGEGRFVSPDGLNPYVLSFDGQPAAVATRPAGSDLPNPNSDPIKAFVQAYFDAEKTRDWDAVMKKFAPNVQIVTLRNGKTLRDVRMGHDDLIKEKREDAEQWPVQRQSIDSEVRIKSDNPPYSTASWRMTNRCENPRSRKWNQNQTDITLTIEALDDRLYITRVETAILESSKGEMQNKPAGQTATPPVRKPPGFILKFQ